MHQSLENLTKHAKLDLKNTRTYLKRLNKQTSAIIRCRRRFFLIFQFQLSTLFHLITMKHFNLIQWSR